MDFAEKCNRIFWNTTQLYHQNDDIDFKPINPFEEGTPDYILFAAHWNATLLRELEKKAAGNDCDSATALDLYRRATALRSDVAADFEALDPFLDSKEASQPQPDAEISAVTPAEAIATLSRLSLDLFDTDTEVRRPEAAPAYVEKCRLKLRELILQREKLTTAITSLLNSIADGKTISYKR